MRISEFIKSKQKKPQPNNPQEAFDIYSKMNSDDLYTQLKEQGSVSSGKVKPEELDSFFERAGPYLNKEQRVKMAKLIEDLKRS
ncbi:MAG: hypothetical protein WCR54_06710 [Clostridia bacterium]